MAIACAVASAVPRRAIKAVNSVQASISRVFLCFDWPAHLQQVPAGVTIKGEAWLYQKPLTPTTVQEQPQINHRFHSSTDDGRQGRSGNAQTRATSHTKNEQDIEEDTQALDHQHHHEGCSGIPKPTKETNHRHVEQRW